MIVQKLSDGSYRRKMNDVTAKKGNISIPWRVDKESSNQNEDEFIPYINGVNGTMGSFKTLEEAGRALKKFARKQYKADIIGTI